MAAVKRQAISLTSYDDLISAKTLKLDENVDFLEKDLDFGCKQMEKGPVDISLSFDTVFNEFCVVIRKEKDNEKKCRHIGLCEEELRALVKKLPIGFSLIEKYSAKKAGKVVDIPVELVSFESENDCKAVLFIKENRFKKSDYQLDIRKCYKGEDGEYMYTTDGVRVGRALAEEILSHLNCLIDIINEQVALSREVMEMIQVGLLIKSILNLKTQTGCDGCKDMLPGQDGHMSSGGCLQDWEDTVMEFWEPALRLMKEEELANLAEEVMELIPKAKGLVTSVLRTDEPQQTHIKKMVLGRTMLEENELYASCKIVLYK